jgi:hypothetical protein
MLLCLGEGHISLGRGLQVRAHLCEHCEPVMNNPEEVVEVLVAFQALAGVREGMTSYA